MTPNKYANTLYESFSLQSTQRAADSAQKISAAVDRIAKTPESRKRMLKSEIVRIRTTAMKQSGMAEIRDMNNAIADILQHALDAM